MGRMTIGLTIVVLVLLLDAYELMGGGGPSPPPNFSTKITGPAVSATIVMDPHTDGLTFVDDDRAPGPKAKYASIRLQKGNLFSGAVFKIPDIFQFAIFGCDTSKTTDRFVNTPSTNNKLTDWIPDEIVKQIFADLGIAVTTTNVPVITDVDNDICTADPENQTTLPGPGILSFQAVIQLQVPQ